MLARSRARRRGRRIWRRRRTSSRSVDDARPRAAGSSRSSRRARDVGERRGSPALAEAPRRVLDDQRSASSPPGARWAATAREHRRRPLGAAEQLERAASARATSARAGPSASSRGRRRDGGDLPRASRLARARAAPSSQRRARGRSPRPRGPRRARCERDPARSRSRARAPARAAARRARSQSARSAA